MASTRKYESFQPQFTWGWEEKASNLIIDLPGFKKEQLRVQLDNMNNLKISGERPLEGQRWIRFSRDFQIPDDSNVNGIRAKFEKETLYIIIPTIERSPSRLPPPLPLEEPKHGTSLATQEKPKEESQGRGQLEQKPEQKVEKLADQGNEEKRPLTQTLEEKPTPTPTPTQEERRIATPTHEEKQPQVLTQEEKPTPMPTQEERRPLPATPTTGGGEGRRSDKEGEMHGVLRKRPRARISKSLINIVVAMIVIIGLGVYAILKFWPAVIGQEAIGQGNEL